MQRSSMEYGAVFFAVIGIFFGMVESTYTGEYQLVNIS